jgi:hypothetical protein
MRILDFTDGFESSTEPTFIGIDASEIGVTPTGNLSSDNAQDALEELQGDIDDINDSVGAASGIASLDGDGKIPSSQIPAIAIVRVYEVADITERDALTVDEGDVAVVGDNGSGVAQSYIYGGSDWVVLEADASLLAHKNSTTGIHGVTGSVVGTSDSQTLTNKTIVASSNTITTASSGNLTATELNAALAELQTDIDTRVTTTDFSNHTGDTSDAHDASAISFDNNDSGLTATDVQEAIDEIAGLSGNVFYPPTISRATASGTGTGGFGAGQTGWLFNITTSTTVAEGDTYTNNGNTYTVLAALTAQTGQVLFCSGNGALSGTTLTRATGAGSATITFTNTGTNPLNPTALYTYTTPVAPRAPVYLKVKMVGGGGGGAGVNANQTDVDGVGGGTTVFGTLFAACVGGAGATSQTGASSLGTVNYDSSPWLGSAGSTLLYSVVGGSGSGGMGTNTNVVGNVGGHGGSSIFGGAGGGGASDYPSGSTTGFNAAANSGAGGGGAGNTFGLAKGVGGGQAGGAMEFIIGSGIAATYLYAVGSGGAGGNSTNDGGAGAAGQIIIEEHYQ